MYKRQVRAGGNPQLTTRQKHTRECWVVLEEGADAQAVEKQIVEMPNYFDEYDVTVNFISQEELDRDHAGLPHGGFVIRTGTTAGGNDCRIEYSLDLGSNPEFTACVLVSYARAVARLASEGAKGCKTVFDIAPAYLSSVSGEAVSYTHLDVYKRQRSRCASTLRRRTPSWAGGCSPTMWCAVAWRCCSLWCS